MTYNVVVHYEGAYNYEVDAENEEDAKIMAKTMFMDEDPMNVWGNVDWNICDVWEEK